MKKLILSIGLLVGATFTYGQTEWTIDKSHSSVGFAVTHLVISEVEGQFNDFDAKVVSTSDDFAGSTVEFTAKAASIDTDNEQRDTHLKSDDFFNAEKFPEVKFNGKIVKNGAKYQLVGKFTMRDVTKDVTFDVKYNGTIKDPWGNIKSGFKVTGTVNRKEYGLKWGALTEAGGAVVSDEVEIAVNVELQKKG
ncbi:YceI family protein [Fulvivirga lutimaris]|uniref:YceI family protein n=1 Tax=Fulvivirga lutimaris TaxID=1819566 RepID=UPI0012BC3EF5|nr:YceI family protein [Fulvivirga lutimaris]MTI39644.1 polyisoprenoid-binding protein [Fulvivirga lutimaris]